MGGASSSSNRGGRGNPSPTAKGHHRRLSATPTTCVSRIAPRETSSTPRDARTFAPQNQPYSFCHIFPFCRSGANATSKGANLPQITPQIASKPFKNRRTRRTPQKPKNHPQNCPSSRPNRPKTAPSPVLPPKAPPNCFPIPFFEATPTKIHPEFAKKRAKSAFLPPRPVLFHVKHGFLGILRLFDHFSPVPRPPALPSATKHTPLTPFLRLLPTISACCRHFAANSARFCWHFHVLCHCFT